MPLQPLATDDLRRRLHKVEGQVRGVAGMIERHEPCIDILTQLAAVRGSLDAIAVGVVAAQIHIDAEDGVGNLDEVITAVARLV